MPRVKSKNNKKNTIETALSAVRKGIMEGRFAPGQRLVEVDLMKELGVSRGDIREVFRFLEIENIVSIEKNRGASVRLISKREVEETFTVLEHIDLLAVKTVAIRSQIPEVRKALEQSLKITQTFDSEINQHYLAQDYMEENTRFWGCLYELSGNSVLKDTKNRLELPLYRLQLKGVVVRTHQKEWVTRHQEILLALLDGNAEKASNFVVKAQHDVLHAMLSLPDTAYL